MRLFNIASLLVLSLNAFAQDDQDIPQRDPKVEEKIRAAHAAYITERLSLTPDEAERFWPVYREYAKKRRDIRQQFESAKEKGASEQELLDLDLKVKQQQLDLEKGYSEKFQKVITAEKLVRLKEAEGDFRRLLLRKIQQRQMHQGRRGHQRERSQERLRHK